jgi:hypothetical protein
MKIPRFLHEIYDISRFSYEIPSSYIPFNPKKVNENSSRSFVSPIPNVIWTMIAGWGDPWGRLLNGRFHGIWWSIL